MDDYRNSVDGDGDLGIFTVNKYYREFDSRSGYYYFEGGAWAFGQFENFADTDVFELNVISGLTYEIFSYQSDIGLSGIYFDEVHGAEYGLRYTFTASQSSYYLSLRPEHYEINYYEIALSLGKGTNVGEYITGTDSNDPVDGGGGDDTIFGLGGDDYIFGGTGRNEVYGGSGSDTLISILDSENFFYGGDSNDIFDLAFYSKNSAYGGYGDDYFELVVDYYDNMSLDDIPVNLIDGGSGIDTLFMPNGFTGHFDLSTGRIVSKDGLVPHQRLISIEKIYGTMGSDTIIGDDKDNYLNGYYGYDTLYGGFGNDSLSGGASGNDNIYGGDGNDTIYGGGLDFDVDFAPDADIIYGDSGDDYVVGLGHDDLIFGGSGSDILYGDVAGVYYDDYEYGNDKIYGGLGVDTLYGGQGDDVFEGGPQSDTFYGGFESDTMSGEDESDTVLYDQAGSAIEVDLTAGYASLPGTTSLYEYLYAIENIEAGSGSDVIRGSSAENRLVGNAGNDQLYGGEAADGLYGGAGNDALYGGTNQDQLYGGDGNDVLHGGTDIDRLDGGAGVDTIVTAGTGALRIDLGLGRLSFPGTTLGQEVLVGIENVISSDGADALIGSAAANVLRGGAGADVIVGAGGADTLIGGLGNDTFRFLSEADSRPGQADRLIAGDGASMFAYPGAAIGDRIDLSALDANLQTSGNQAFVFGTAKTVGRVWLAEVGTDTHVRANTDADAAYETEIVLVDGSVRASAYAGADFLL